MTTYMKIQKAVISALIFFTCSSHAGPILGGVVGSAKNEVNATCTPVCSVTNKSQHRIRASLSVVSMTLTKELSPGETHIFTLNGSSFDSAFGISVDYI